MKRAWIAIAWIAGVGCIECVGCGEPKPDRDIVVPVPDRAMSAADGGIVDAAGPR